MFMYVFIDEQIKARWRVYVFYLKQPLISHQMGPDRNSPCVNGAHKRKNKDLQIFQLSKSNQGYCITIWYLYQTNFTSTAYK